MHRETWIRIMYLLAVVVCLSIYISTSTRTYLLCTQMYIIYPNKHWPLHTFTHLPETSLSARNQEKHLATIKKRKYVYSCRWNSCGHKLGGKQNDMKTHKLLPPSIHPKGLRLNANESSDNCWMKVPSFPATVVSGRNDPNHLFRPERTHNIIHQLTGKTWWLFHEALA